RAGAPQRHGGVLAVPVRDHAVAAVQGPLADRIDQVESLDHRSGRQHFDLQIAAGHVVHLGGEVHGVFVEDVLRRPGALPAHGNGSLRLHHRGESERRGTCTRRSGAGDELATGYDGRLLLLFHTLLLCLAIEMRTWERPLATASWYAAAISAAIHFCHRIVVPRCTVDGR